MPTALLSIPRSFIQSSGVLNILAVFAVFLLLERWLYAERNQSVRGILFNVRYTLLYLVIAAVLQPAMGFVTSLAVVWAGGGWISLPHWFGNGALNAIFRTVTNLFFFDFFYYWFHRFQHALPVLWCQHKLHHSDLQLNVTTTHRHHWLEEP